MEYPEDFEPDTDLTESYLRQYGAAWDDPDEAAREMEDGIY